MKRRWLATTSTYTVTGALSSAAVGAILSLLGEYLMPAFLPRHSIAVIMIIGVVALGYEFGLLPVQLPQLRRQTHGTWSRYFPREIAAALWGFDIGAVFSTRLTFAGVWVLTIVTLLAGNLWFGVALFVAYWLGRVMPIWLSPILLNTDDAALPALAMVGESGRLFRRIQIIGIVWLLLVVAL